MLCDHEHGFCAVYEFAEDLTLEEFVERLIHFFGKETR